MPRLGSRIACNGLTRPGKGLSITIQKQSIKKEMTFRVFLKQINSMGSHLIQRYVNPPTYMYIEVYHVS